MIMVKMTSVAMTVSMVYIHTFDSFFPQAVYAIVYSHIMPNKRVIVRGLPVEGPEVVLKRADISDLLALQIPSGQPIDLTGTGFAATPVAGRVVGAGPHTFVHTLPGGQHAVFMGGLCPRYTINNGARPIGVGRDWAAFLLGGQVVVYTLDEVYVHALAPEVGEVVGVAVSSLGGGQMLWLIAKGGSVVYVSIAADSHVGGGVCPRGGPPKLQSGGRHRHGRPRRGVHRGARR